MSLVKYTQLPLSRYLDRDEFLAPFDRLFDDVFSNQFPELSKELGVGFFEKQSYPRVDVVDYNDRVEILAEVPGLSKDEVNVEVQDDVLTISGQKVKRVEESEQNKKYIRKELKHSSFKRSFTLSDTIDRENLEAKFDNGLLKIVLKKIKPIAPPTRRVQIQ